MIIYLALFGLFVTAACQDSATVSDTESTVDETASVSAEDSLTACYDDTIAKMEQKQADRQNTFKAAKQECMDSCGQNTSIAACFNRDPVAARTAYFDCLKGNPGCTETLNLDSVAIARLKSGFSHEKGGKRKGKKRGRGRKDDDEGFCSELVRSMIPDDFLQCKRDCVKAKKQESKEADNQGDEKGRGKKGGKRNGKKGRKGGKRGKNGGKRGGKGKGAKQGREKHGKCFKLFCSQDAMSQCRQQQAEAAKQRWLDNCNCIKTAAEAAGSFSVPAALSGDSCEDIAALCKTENDEEDEDDEENGGEEDENDDDDDEDEVE